MTLVDSFVHNCYFNWTGTFLGTAATAGGVGIPGNWIMPVMSVGQIAEILTMFVLGATLKSFGWRTTMIFGILGHAARFAVYAFFPQVAGLIIIVQILHGICYAFFFATVYIFVDAYFPKDARASAQGLFNVMILGLGALLANSICPTMRRPHSTSCWPRHTRDCEGTRIRRTVCSPPSRIQRSASLRTLAVGSRGRAPG